MIPKHRYNVVANDCGLLEIVGTATSSVGNKGVYYTFDLAKRAAVIHACQAKHLDIQERKAHMAFIRKLKLKQIDFEL